MRKSNQLVLTIIALLISVSVFAQSPEVEIKDGSGMTSHGKIYVVLAIALTILAGLLLYVTRLDRKISKLEKGNL